MKIHITTPFWHGNFHGFVGKAFESLGHEVVFFDQNGTRAEIFLQKIILRVPKVQHVLDRRLREHISKRWLASIYESKPDLVLLIDMTTNITFDAVQKAKEKSPPVFYWATAPSVESGAKDILAGMHYATKAFSIDRTWTPPLVFGEGDTPHLPLAGDSKDFYPIPNSKKIYEVSFVGSFSESWDGFIRAYVLSKVAEKYKVAIFGHGISYWFKCFPNIEPCVVKESVIDVKILNEVYNQTKIVLNIHSASHKTSLSARTFEIGLAGAFQLITDQEDLPHLFSEDMFRVFRNIPELMSLIDHWLPKDSEREIFAAKFREEVLVHHTWRNRAETIIGYLK